MEANEILVQVRAQDEVPESWDILPLQKQQLLGGLMSWIVGAIISLGLLALIGPVVIPFNYEHSLISAIFSTLLLAFLLFVAGGSIYLLVIDILRVIRAEDYVIILTEADFLHSEGKNITHVPFSAIRDVVARGPSTLDPQQPVETAESTMPTAGGNMMQLFLGSRAGASKQQKRNRRSPVSLTFQDTRTNKQVVVCNDTAYGSPYAVADLLRDHIATWESSQQGTVE